jgi:hypothetical protein
MMLRCAAVIILALLPLASAGASPAAQQRRADTALVDGAAILASPNISIARRPTVVIGDPDGGDRHELGEVLAAARLADGSIAVADRDSREIRIFDAAGRYLRAVGGRGSGPGEFQALGAFAVSGDSLFVQDLATALITVFDAHGRLLRTFALQPDPESRRDNFIGPVQNGMFVGSATSVRQLRAPSRISHVDLAVFVYDRAGRRFRSLGNLLSREVTEIPTSMGDGTAQFLRPFGLVGTVRTGGGRVYMGDGERCEIRILDLDGVRQRLARFLLPPMRVQARDREEEQTRLLDFYPRRSRELLRSAWSSLEFKEFLPAFRRFELDARGRIWIERWTDQERTGALWFVFDAQLRPVGQLRLPRGIDVKAIYADGLLVVRSGTDGVNRVEYYPFTSAPR